jgi:hypothetical protein
MSDSDRSMMQRLLDALKNAGCKASTTSKRRSNESPNSNRALGWIRFADCVRLAETSTAYDVKRMLY